MLTSKNCDGKLKILFAQVKIQKLKSKQSKRTIQIILFYITQRVRHTSCIIGRSKLLASKSLNWFQYIDFNTLIPNSTLISSNSICKAPRFWGQTKVSVTTKLQQNEAIFHWCKNTENTEVYLGRGFLSLHSFALNLVINFASSCTF